MKNIGIRQFDTYSKESCFKGDSPKKNGKVWIDYISKSVQDNGIRDMKLDDVRWSPYEKVKIRNGIRLIKIQSNHANIYINLNPLERLFEFCRDNLEYFVNIICNKLKNLIL